MEKQDVGSEPFSAIPFSDLHSRIDELIVIRGLYTFVVSLTKSPPP